MRIMLLTDIPHSFRRHLHLLLSCKSEAMETTMYYNEIMAAFITRVFLGILFFFQGYDAVFRIGVSNVIRTYKESFAGEGMPVFLIVCGSWFTSLSELAGGFLLIIG